MMMELADASCPDCGGMVLYSTKDEASGWKVYVTCDECGYDRRVGWVKLSEVDHRDEVGELARKRARDYVRGE